MPTVFKLQWDRIPKVCKGIGAGVGTLSWEAAGAIAHAGNQSSSRLAIWG